MKIKRIWQNAKITKWITFVWIWGRYNRRHVFKNVTLHVKLFLILAQQPTAWNLSEEVGTHRHAAFNCVRVHTGQCWRSKISPICKHCFRNVRIYSNFNAHKAIFNKCPPPFLVQYFVFLKNRILNLYPATSKILLQLFWCK